MTPGRGPQGDPRTTLTHAPARSGYGPEVEVQNLRPRQRAPETILEPFSSLRQNEWRDRAGRLALDDLVDLENLRITRELDPNIAGAPA